MKTNPSPHAGAVLAITTKARRFLLFIAHLDFKVDPLNLDDQFASALRSTAEAENVHWKVVRRDIILGLHYHGSGAQKTFLKDLSDALHSGNFVELAKRLPLKDQTLVEDVLNALPFCGITTARWLSEQMEQKNLLSKLATALKFKFPRENEDALRGDIHMAIAVWGAGGSLDAYLRVGRPPSPRLMTGVGCQEDDLSALPSRSRCAPSRNAWHSHRVRMQTR